MVSLLVTLLACGSPPPPPPPKVTAPPPKAPEAPDEEVTYTREAPNRAPVVKKATLQTRAPTAKDDIVALLDAMDPDDNPVDVTVHWTLNDDELVGYTDLRLPAGAYKRGDRIHGTADVSDGTATTHADFGEVVIQNANPVIDTPASQVLGLDGVRLQAHDPDGDALKWTVEGAPEGLSIDDAGMISYHGSATAKGGNFVVKIKADDGNGGWARLDVPVSVRPGSDAPKDEPPAGSPAR